MSAKCQILGACRHRGMKSLLEVVSFEVPAENVGTVARAQSWRQRIPNFGRCDREATSA